MNKIWKDVFGISPQDLSEQGPRLYRRLSEAQWHIVFEDWQVSGCCHDLTTSCSATVTSAGAKVS